MDHWIALDRLTDVLVGYSFWDYKTKTIRYFQQGIHKLEVNSTDGDAKLTVGSLKFETTNITAEFTTGLTWVKYTSRDDMWTDWNDKILKWFEPKRFTSEIELRGDLKLTVENDPKRNDGLGYLVTLHFDMGVNNEYKYIFRFGGFGETTDTSKSFLNHLRDIAGKEKKI